MARTTYHPVRHDEEVGWIMVVTPQKKVKTGRFSVNKLELTNFILAHGGDAIVQFEDLVAGKVIHVRARHIPHGFTKSVWDYKVYTTRELEEAAS